VNALAHTMVRGLLGQKNYQMIMFKRKHGYSANLRHPQTFSEKIQWLKYYGDMEKFSPFVDKYEVRKFIAEKIGDKYLVPLLGLYNNADKIDFATLPQSFVIKTTHGSGWNIIVPDKSKLDIQSAKSMLNKWANLSFYDVFHEPIYRPIKGRLVIEQFLNEASGDLKDYKFFCFNGVPEFVQVDSERFIQHKRDLYTLNWNKIAVKYGYANLPREADRPEKLDEMIFLARQLSDGFPFVRVDLYFTNGNIYFGEMTFTPENGMVPFTPTQYDYELGELLDLTKY
jgi:hypothetical protein